MLFNLYLDNRLYKTSKQLTSFVSCFWLKLSTSQRSADSIMHLFVYGNTETQMSFNSWVIMTLDETVFAELKVSSKVSSRIEWRWS